MHIVHLSALYQLFILPFFILLIFSGGSSKPHMDTLTDKLAHYYNMVKLRVNE